MAISDVEVFAHLTDADIDSWQPNSTPSGATSRMTWVSATCATSTGSSPFSGAWT